MQSGDGERRDSPRTSGGWKENDNGGAWGMENVAKEKGQSNKMCHSWHIVAPLA